MASLDVDACRVRWAHAANTTALLDAACRSADRPHFVEADIIVLCVVDNDGGDNGRDAIAVMGHDAHAIASVPRDRLLAEHTFSAWLAHALELMHQHQCVFGAFSIARLCSAPGGESCGFCSFCTSLVSLELQVQASSSTLKTRAQSHRAFSTCAVSALRWMPFRFG
jgi:hypothetical protein